LALITFDKILTSYYHPRLACFKSTNCRN